MANLSDLFERLQGSFDELLSTDDTMGIQDRQVIPLEEMLLHSGYNPSPPFMLSQDIHANHMRPVYKLISGRVGYTYFSAGVLPLWVAKPGEDNPNVLFMQYMHRPKLQKSPTGNLEYYNEGISNVFMTNEGAVYGMIMLENGEYLTLPPWRPKGMKLIGRDYPDSGMEALDIIRQVSSQANILIPFSPKTAMLMLLAADTYRDIKRDYLETEKELMLIGGKINYYKITPSGVPAELAEFLGVEPGAHPLRGMVEEDLIPPEIEVVILDNYLSLLSILAEGGFPMPTFFRDHERGLYTSIFAPWDNQSSSFGIREVLSFNGLELDRAIILPSQAPKAREAWQTPWEIFKHHSMLQVFEELPMDKKQYLFDFCEECVPQVKHLLNSTYSSVRVPDIGDKNSPYNFNKYSTKEQARMIGAFVAGIMTIGKPVHRYWSRQIWGDGSDPWNYAPELTRQILSEIGINVEMAPDKTVYPYFMRPAGSSVEEWPWPTAESSGIFTDMEYALSKMAKAQFPDIVNFGEENVKFEWQHVPYHLGGVDLVLAINKYVPTPVGGISKEPYGKFRLTAVNPWKIGDDDGVFRYAIIHPVESKGNIGLDAKINEYAWTTVMQEASNLGFVRLYLDADPALPEYKQAQKLGFKKIRPTTINDTKVNLSYDING